MIYLALATVVEGTIIVLVALGFLAYLRSLTRSNDRRVDKLLDRNDSLQDRLAHAEGRPWQKPPREQLEGLLVDVDPELQLVEPGEEWEL